MAKPSEHLNFLSSLAKQPAMKRRLNWNIARIAAIPAFMWGLPLFLFAQNSPVDSTRLRPLADSLKVWEYKNYDKASRVVEATLDLCAKQDWWRAWFDYCQEGVNVAAYHGRNDERLRYIEWYDAMLPKRRNELGPLYQQYRNRSRQNRATWHYRTGDVHTGRNQFVSLVNELRAASGNTREDSTTLYLSAAFVASIDRELGNYAEGIIWQAYVIGLKQRLATQKARPWLHIDYSNLAALHRRLGQPEKAADDYRKSLADLNYSLQLAPNNPALFPNALSVHQNIALFKLEQHQPDSAIFYLNHALQKGWANTEGLKARTYSILALAWQQKGDFQKAKGYFEQSLSLNEKILGDRHYQTALAWKNMGDLEAHQNRQEEALTLYQTALACLSPNFDKNDHFASPALSGIYAKRQFLEILGSKSECLWTLAERYPGERRYPESALQTGEIVVALVDSLRLGFSEETDKFRLTELVYPVFERTIAAALYLAETDPAQSGFYREKAWALAEKNKALVMQENLRQSAALEASLSDELRIQESKLRRELASLEKKIYDAEIKPGPQNETELSSLRQVFFERRSERADLHKQIQAEQGKWFDAMYKYEANDWRKVSEALPTDAALLEYFVGGRTVFVFCVTKNGMESRQFELSSEFSAHVSNLYAALTDNTFRFLGDDVALFRQSAAALYDLLLRPSLQLLQQPVHQLVIVPDERLGYIPFEVLLTDTEGKAYADFPYLLRQYSIRYLPSANMLFDKHVQQSWRQVRHSLAGFAPDYENKDTLASGALTTRTWFARKGNYSLPGAQEEVREITRLVGGHSFLGDTATERNFRELANQYRVLHLAMHAMPDTSNPLFSHLLFAGPDDDNTLYANEIYAMQLNADLAVLSACETGYGLARRGDGIQSLGWAFAYAGVPATVQSLWQAPDGATRTIMVAFYRHLQAGMGKSNALRQAKLDWLANASAAEANPFLWAGFVIYGNDAPVEGLK